MQNMFWYDAVQIVALLAVWICLVWIGKELIKHRDRLTIIETTLSNHYAHRFQKIKEHLGVNWDDEE